MEIFYFVTMFLVPFTCGILVDGNIRCVEPWILIRQRCYFVSNERRPWKDANQLCSQMGGYLLKLNDVEEHQVFREYVAAEEQHGLWTGGYRLNMSNTFIWHDGSVVSDSKEQWQTFAYLHDTENNCLLLDWITRYFKNINCGIAKYFACEKDLCMKVVIAVLRYDDVISVTNEGSSLLCARTCMMDSACQSFLYQSIGTCTRSMNEANLWLDTIKSYFIAQNDNSYVRVRPNSCE